MYVAKEGGRNQVQVTAPGSTSMDAIKALVSR